MPRKPKYNPRIHNRRSIRLKGYDYSQAGAYFVTMCCQDRACRFGTIHNGEMILNDAGQMVEKWYSKLSEKFPDIHCGEHTTMPNHFHAIIINTGSAPDPGFNPSAEAAEEEGSAAESGDGGEEEGDHMGSPQRGSPQRGSPQPVGSSSTEGTSLATVIQWFKTMTTNEYIRGVKQLGWEPFDRKLWQRNYYEHIIRNERSYDNIANYILSNPQRWENDRFFQ